MFFDNFDDERCFPILREFSNVWTMDKDGKKWFNATEFPEIMRK